MTVTPLESVGSWTGPLNGMSFQDGDLLELEFAGIDLTGSVDYGGFTFVALAEGASLGNPVPVYRTVESAIQNGSRVETERYENRDDVQFQLLILATSSTLLARAERALFLRCGRRATLLYRPPDGSAPRTLFQAHTSMPTHDYDDMNELRVVRAYTLSLTCDPWGYSDVEVMVDAVESTTAANPTVIADGTSAANWTSPNGTVTASGGILRVPSGPVVSSTPSKNGGQTTHRYTGEATRTFSPAADFSATKYVGAEVTFPGQAWYNIRQIRAYIDGVDATVVSRETLAEGYRYVWQTSDTSVNALRVTVDDLNILLNKGVAPPASVTFGIDNVVRSQSPPATGTGRESFREVTVHGSAPSPATWEIQHETQALGETLLYTSPRLGENGYSPDMRRWLTSTNVNTSTEAAAINGSTVRNNGASGSSAQTALIFSPPAALFPDGKYLLMVNARAVNAAVTVNATMDMTTVASQTATPVVAAQNVGSISVPSNGALATYAFGFATLPVAQTERENKLFARIIFNSAAGMSAFYVDQVWLFWMGPDSGLTTVRSVPVGLSTNPARRLRIQSSSIDRDAHLIAGIQPDWSDAFHPSAQVDRWGEHIASPPMTQLHVVTTVATYPRVTLRTRPAWHTFAADLPPGTTTL